MSNTYALKMDKPGVLKCIHSCLYTPNSRPKPKCHGRIEFIHYYALVSARMPAMDGVISKTEAVSTVFRSISSLK